MTTNVATIALGLGRTIQPGLLIASLMLLDAAIFPAAFGISYFKWYLANGVVIHLISGFIALALDLDRFPELLSPNPRAYLAAVFAVVGLSVYTLGATFGASAEMQRRESLLATTLSLVQVLVAGVLLLAIWAAYLAWVLVIAPAQYVVFLPSGAPARITISSKTKMLYGYLPGGALHYREVPADAPIPNGYSEAGYRQRPVSLTNAVAAGVLWLANQALPA